MKMDKGLDTGDMILTVKTPITDTDDLESIHDRLADISGDALIEAIKQIENGTAVYTPQDSEKATYAEKILKDDEPVRGI
jgi:methionyl-tRNA formyltransferase